MTTAMNSLDLISEESGQSLKTIAYSTIFQ